MELSEILARCDHTLLRQDCTAQEIMDICDQGIKYKTASVCIPPCHVAGAKHYVGDELKICTVIGFPNGYSTAKVKAFEAADAVQREFGLHAQEAYETLLYLQPSPPEVPACSIRPLTAEDSAEAARYYHLFDDPQPYLRGRAEAGALWGHFTAEGRLAGFLGIHSEGSMGMLEVVPEFRRHGIAQALEAALIRLHLERGWLPFCFVAPDNVPSLSLQAKLGLTNIHIPAIWLF